MQILWYLLVLLQIQCQCISNIWYHVTKLQIDDKKEKVKEAKRDLKQAKSDHKAMKSEKTRK